MNDEEKNKDQVLDELSELHQIITELEDTKKSKEMPPSIENFESFITYAPDAKTRPMTLKRHHISELMDIPLLQQLFDSFFELTGIMHAMLDTDNQIITSTGWEDICTKFHRCCPQTESRCQQSDSFIQEHLYDGAYIGYKCLNGLMDYATPIIVEGQHLATIFMGQLLHEPADEEYFRQQARKFGFNEVAYIKALRHVKIVPEKNIKHIMKFYSKLAQVLTSMGLERARRMESAENKFYKAFHCSPDPIAIISLKEGRFFETNETWEVLTGYMRSEAIGRTVTELEFWVSPDDPALILREINEKGNIRNQEISFRMRSGEIRTFLISVEVISIDEKAHLLCMHKDITDRKKFENALRLSEERFSKAFNTSPVTMTISTFEEGRYISVNDSFCEVVGYNHQEIIGQTSVELGIWVDSAFRQKVKQKILANEPIRETEIRFRRKSGEERFGLFSAERIDVDGEICLLNVLNDITERKQAEDQIKYLSFYDKLTGLYNRAFFEEELKRLDTERQLPLSLFMGDVNGLKMVNDALGHQEGDKLLVTVAELLKKSCRKEDIVARWGGDEFIILLPLCSSKTATKIFKRIKDSCQHINDLPIQTSISLGWAIKNHPAQDIRGIIKEAEDKMYRNKLLESRSARSTFLVSLEQTLWTRSHETKEHCQRMQEIAQKIGQAINLPDSELDNLKLLAALHDIGKIAIPNSILDKPGKLSPEEWESIKKHPEIGYRIALSSPEMAPIAEAILYHHERWDGTGYPLKLKGVHIPLISRIIAIADTYDVMINGRPYQGAVSKEAVCAEIERCAGTQFDPYLASKAAQLFLEL
ncbi:MAG: PocR ligand-binding domain-containing protein [Syntrophomonas sp.]